MQPELLDPPKRTRRRKPTPWDPPTTPKPAQPSRAFSVLVSWLLPVAAGGALLAVTRGLPLDLREQALVASPDRLPPLARALAAALGAHTLVWRIGGAVAVAIAGIAAALLGRRLVRHRAVPAIAGCVVATHVLVLSGGTSLEGTLGVLAFSAIVLACALVAKSAARAAAAALAVLAAGALVAPAPPRLPEAAALLTILNRRPDSPTASIAAAVISLLAIVCGIAWAKRRPAGVPVACLAAAAFCAMGFGSLMRTLADSSPARHEAVRFAVLLDAKPPLAPARACEVVLDAPVSIEDLALARPLRHLVPTLDDAATAARIRVLQWGPPRDEGALSLQPPIVHEVLEGTIDPGILLVAPAPGARLEARIAGDEPEFRFEVPGLPADLSHVRVVIVAETSARTRVFERDLEEAIVRRSTEDGRTTLAWRPAWRPMACAERELRWEDGDLVERGRAFWWTVAVDGPAGTRIAPLRKLFVAP